MKEFLTDLEIASAASKNDITDIGNLIGIPSDALIPYGNDKAKVTYDFIDMEGCYYGGAIAPGILMRYKALNNFTKKLPLLEPSNSYNLIGNSTETCIHSGVILGVINEIDSAVNQYKEKIEDLTVVLTGGDVNFLSNRLKNGIFANPNFLLEGLNTILTYNL